MRGPGARKLRILTSAVTDVAFVFNLEGVLGFILGVFEGPLALIWRSWAHKGQMLVSRVGFLEVLMVIVDTKTSKNSTREMSICPWWA